jgi:hypothetical protein
VEVVEEAARIGWIHSQTPHDRLPEEVEGAVEAKGI